MDYVLLLVSNCDNHNIENAKANYEQCNQYKTGGLATQQICYLTIFSYDI